MWTTVVTTAKITMNLQFPWGTHECTQLERFHSHDYPTTTFRSLGSPCKKYNGTCCNQEDSQGYKVTDECSVPARKAKHILNDHKADIYENYFLITVTVKMVQQTCGKND